MASWNAHDEAMAAEMGVSVEEYLRRGKEEAAKARVSITAGDPGETSNHRPAIFTPETHCPKCGVSHELRELMERLFREWLMKRLGDGEG